MAYARFMHGAVGAGRFDVYGNGMMLYPNLSYGMYSNYLPISDGINQVTLYPAGTMANPLVTSNLSLLPGGIYTIAAGGYPGNVVLMPMQEQMPSVSPGQSYLRFMNLCPNSPNVDVILPDGTVIFGNISANARTAYTALIPGAYTFLVRPTGTTQAIVATPLVTLALGSSYTLYLYGMVGSVSNPPNAIVSQDGTGVPS